MQLLGVKVRWLQGWRRRLVGLLGRLFLAALYAITHPFAHLWLVTQKPGQEQWSPGIANQRCQHIFPFQS